jgi:hypothetical protein
MTKELNTTHVFVPKGVGRHEHHCRRWVSIQLLKKLAKKQKAGKNPELLVSAQRSDFGGEEGIFFNIAIARPLSIDQNKNSCMTLGFRIDDGFKNKHAFWNDDNVPVVRVNETCERCSLSAEECSQRVASPTILNKQREIEEKTESLREFIENAKE